MNRRLTCCLVILGLVVAVAACTSGGDGSRSLSTVTISIGGGNEGASSPARKAPPAVGAVTITIAGEGMTAIAKSVPITPPATISEVFSVPSGSARTFSVEALDAGGTASYRGSSTVDLDGTPVILDISMTPLFFAGTKQFGTAAYDEANAVARDGGGNIFIAGTTAGDLEGNTNNGSLDAYVMKFDSTGSKLWTKLSGSAGAESAFGVAPDGSGGAYLFGITTDGLDGNAQTGLVDCFVARFDGSGARLWTKQFGGSAGLCNAGGATSDTSGNLYVAGYADASLDGKPALGGYDAFVMKFDPAGNRLWTVVNGTPSDDYGNAISLDTAGNVFVAGSTYGSPVSPNPDPEGVTSDLFILKIDGSAGAAGWTVQLGTADSDDALAVAVDGTGNVYVAGRTFAGLDGNTALGNYDLFVVKYDGAGAKQWTRQAGSAANDVAWAVAADPSGNVFVAGQTGGALGAGASAGANDIFLIKLDAAGTGIVWTRQGGTAADEKAEGLVVDAAGGVFIAGTTSGGLDGNANAGEADGFLQAYDADGLIL